ncbi:hypothetical protein Tco_0772985 [Tanacetum coccineum]|uniref:Uncharacterized protein n=1 Tax=Tanacetum coccineum TaxID=301880 RepID=A0ABQ4ZJF9_9ASTR
MVGSLMYLIPTYADEDPCGMSGDSREVRREGAQSLGDCWLAGHQDAKNSEILLMSRIKKEVDDFIIPALRSISSDHLKMEMEMEIPSSSNVKLMTECTDRDLTLVMKFRKIHKVSKLRKLDIYSCFTSAQDGNKLLDDERLSLADDLKKAHDQNQNKSK